MVACGLRQGAVPYDSLAAEASDRPQVAFRRENLALFDRGKLHYASSVELVSFVVDRGHQMWVEAPTGPVEALAGLAFLVLAQLYAHQGGSPDSPGLGGQSPVVAAHS